MVSVKDTIQFVIFGIMLLLVIGTSIYYLKRIKHDKVGMDTLALYLKDMIIIAQQVVELNQIKRSDYASDKDYYKAMGVLISDDIRNFLINKSGLDKNIINRIDDQTLLDISYNIIEYIVGDKKKQEEVENIDEIVKDDENIG